MGLLVLGLLAFLGMHSVKMLAPAWRAGMIARLGPFGWRAGYSVVSLVGLGLIILGFAQAGPEAPLYAPPLFLRHLNALFTLAAFILIAASYVPANHLKAAIGHPMLAGVKLWAFGHLLANGTPRAILLFGAFLFWAIADFAVSRRRDRAACVVYPPGTALGDVIAAIAGGGFWALFAFYLHQRWIGVAPFG
ncbi:MAG: NnrU family protein [Acidibrevibacterium sp.]|jgi:uncharacterized membrane protein|uniref:NnrU family protein n=1 Tax=Acidibrevibacterium fodinaquatile TaxID=1969806 RepID=UPI0023A7A256|nr:NnrU family protein [Acidibrevibacterium fodinaquatile]MCA7118426.1 NnrU family protein [Acidibrevibacterium fodinaquatile]